MNTPTSLIGGGNKLLSKYDLNKLGSSTRYKHADKSYISVV